MLDQFNPRGIFVDAKKASHLLVPTVKDLVTPPALPGAFTVDHFECYKVSVTSGTEKFVPVLTLPTNDSAVGCGSVLRVSKHQSGNGGPSDARGLAVEFALRRRGLGGRLACACGRLRRIIGP